MPSCHAGDTVAATAGLNESKLRLASLAEGSAGTVKILRRGAMTDLTGTLGRPSDRS